MRGARPEARGIPPHPAFGPILFGTACISPRSERLPPFSPRGRRCPGGADEGGATKSLRISPSSGLRPPSPTRGEGGNPPLSSKPKSCAEQYCPGGADEGARDRKPGKFPLIRPSATFSHEGRRGQSLASAQAQIPCRTVLPSATFSHQGRRGHSLAFAQAQISCRTVRWSGRREVVSSAFLAVRLPPQGGGGRTFLNGR